MEDEVQNGGGKGQRVSTTGLAQDNGKTLERIGPVSMVSIHVVFFSHPQSMQENPEIL